MISNQDFLQNFILGYEEEVDAKKCEGKLKNIHIVSKRKYGISKFVWRFGIEGDIKINEIKVDSHRQK